MEKNLENEVKHFKRKYEDTRAMLKKAEADVKRTYDQSQDWWVRAVKAEEKVARLELQVKELKIKMEKMCRCHEQKEREWRSQIEFLELFND